MLHLHGGRFDEADRLFHSVGETWTGVLRSTSDVKELVPQLYQPELHADGSKSLLRNGRGLRLGVRQDGDQVGDVQLPPWAHGDPRAFVATMREALDGEVASASLHKWVDLIFGCAQRGAAAVAADNVFCPQTYEGNVDLDRVSNAAERRALELQISEFGQTPTQLFDAPHPPRRAGAAAAPLIDEAELVARLSAPPAQPAAAEPPAATKEEETAEAAAAASAGLGDQHRRSLALRPWRRLPVQSEAVGSVCLAEDGVTVVTAGTSPELRVTCGARAQLLRAASAGVLRLSSCVQLRGSDRIVVGSWDASLSVYSVGHGQLCGTLNRAHEDAVACLAAVRGKGGAAPSRMASGSWDTTVRLWELHPSGFGREPLQQFGDTMHHSRVLAVDGSGELVTCGTSDGMLALWDARGALVPVRATRPHGAAALSGVCLADAAQAIVSCSVDGSIVASPLDGTEPTTLRPAGKGTGGAERSVVALGDGSIVASAGDGGEVTLWDVGGGRALGTLAAGGERRAIACLHAVDVDGGGWRLAAGLEDGSCQMWYEGAEPEAAAAPE